MCESRTKRIIFPRYRENICCSDKTKVYGICSVLLSKRNELGILGNTDCQKVTFNLVWKSQENVLESGIFNSLKEPWLHFIQRKVSHEKNGFLIWQLAIDEVKGHYKFDYFFCNENGTGTILATS